MIHKTAIVHPAAKIGKGVKIGPYSIIEENVIISENTTVGPHVVINGHTTIGANNRFFQFCSIGEENQDKKYQGEPTETVIRDDNVFREYCTVHRGTIQDKGLTVIGSNNLFMAYSHVAHDCRIGDNVIMANCATLAGHVEIGNWAILGGFSGIHQFCRIGAHAFLGIRSSITQDVAPFMLYADGKIRSVNSEGLKRREFSKEDLSLLKEAYKIIYRKQLPLNKAIEQLKEIARANLHLESLVQFIGESKRGLTR